MHWVTKCWSYSLCCFELPWELPVESDSESSCTADVSLFVSIDFLILLDIPVEWACKQRYAMLSGHFIGKKI